MVDAVGEGVADEAELALGMEDVAVEGDDAGRFLAAMLQGVQAERRDGGGIRMAEDAEDAAFLAQRVAVAVEVGAEWGWTCAGLGPCRHDRFLSGRRRRSSPRRPYSASGALRTPVAASAAFVINGVASASARGAGGGGGAGRWRRARRGSGASLAARGPVAEGLDQLLGSSGRHGDRVAQALAGALQGRAGAGGAAQSGILALERASRNTQPMTQIRKPRAAPKRKPERPVERRRCANRG